MISEWLAFVQDCRVQDVCRIKQVTEMNWISLPKYALNNGKLPFDKISSVAVYCITANLLCILQIITAIEHDMLPPMPNCTTCKSLVSFIDLGAYTIASH